MLGQKQWREELQYDAITCMFAIHYFFESEKAIKTFLHNVSINLREGSLNTAQLLRYGCVSILSYCLALPCLHKMLLHPFTLIPRAWHWLSAVDSSRCMCHRVIHAL